MDLNEGAPAAPATIPPELIDAAANDAAAAAAAARSSTARSSSTSSPAAIPAVDWTGEGGELVEFTLTLLTPIYPSLAGVYSPAVRAQLALHVGRVLQKYGIDVATLFGRWAPEMGLVLVAVPLIAPTVAAVRADRTAKAAAAGQPAEVTADNPLSRFPRAAPTASIPKTP